MLRGKVRNASHPVQGKKYAPTVRRYGSGNPATAKSMYTQASQYIVQHGVTFFLNAGQKTRKSIKDKSLWPTLARVASVAGAATVVGPAAQWLATKTGNRFLWVHIILVLFFLKKPSMKVKKHKKK